MKIIKAVSFRYLLNDVIKEQGDPMYRPIPSVSDLNSNDQQTEDAFQQPTGTAEGVKIVTKSLQELTAN